jgi:SAM-dependent methyltransferase
MTTVPPLIDRQALDRNRARARSHPDHSDAMFLHRIARADIEERLSEVNRTFTAPAVVTGFPAFWVGLRADATIVADEDLLDFRPEAHDLVVHAMSLHWANDPVGQLIQCRRALQPDGLFIAVLPGGETLSELRASLAEAEVRITGGISPRVLPTAEIRDLGALMQRAGFALPVADSIRQVVAYRSLPSLYRDLRAMGETNVLSGRLRQFTSRRILNETEAVYTDSFRTTDGHLSATFELQFVTGWAPHESQQAPLRPGSAKARLADALRVPEHPLPKGG